MAKNKLNWGSSHKVVDDDSGIRTEFITHAHEPGKVYTKRTQPTADIILERNQRKRIEKPLKDLSFGRHVACIPFNDYEILKKKYPDLASKDAKVKTAAWAKILKDPDNRKYLVQDKY